MTIRNLARMCLVLWAIYATPNIWWLAGIFAIIVLSDLDEKD